MLCNRRALIYNQSVKTLNSYRRCLFLLLICMFFLTSCVRFSQIQSTDDDKNIPDMIMTDATYVFGEKGRRPVVMKASRITIFNRKTDRTELENISFYQDDEMTGSCDMAVVTENNNNAQLTGNIKLYKKTDNFTIMCDSLTWNNKSQIISTQDIVDVKYEDGTTIKARGFTAQLDDNIYEFNQIMEGSYESEK